jgi:hypothetical protein
MKYQFVALMERYWEGKHEGHGEKPVPAPLCNLKSA